MKTKETMLTKMRRGATFIEYALLAALVAIVVATAAVLFGDNIKKIFSTSSSKTENVNTVIKEAQITPNVDPKQ